MYQSNTDFLTWNLNVLDAASNFTIQIPDYLLRYSDDKNLLLAKWITFQNLITGLALFIFKKNYGLFEFNKTLKINKRKEFFFIFYFNYALQNKY